MRSHLQLQARSLLGTRRHAGSRVDLQTWSSPQLQFPACRLYIPNLTEGCPLPPQHPAVGLPHREQVQAQQPERNEITTQSLEVECTGTEDSAKDTQEAVTQQMGQTPWHTPTDGSPAPASMTARRGWASAQRRGQHLPRQHHHLAIHFPPMLCLLPDW